MKSVLKGTGGGGRGPWQGTVRGGPVLHRKVSLIGAEIARW